jgi:hypothetical protein
MDCYTARGIQFFNPQVADWNPSLAAVEADHLVNDEIILFPVTDETTGIGSLSETGFSILSALRSNSQRYFVIFIDPNVKEQIKIDNPTGAKESVRARALVRAHLAKQQHPSVFIVNSLEQMLAVSLQLIQVSEILKNVRGAIT